MATADAADAYEMHGKRVVFGDGNRKFWSPVFEHNPKIAKDPDPDEIVCWVPNYIGHRPYITEIGETHFKVREDFRVKPGEIYLTDEERRWAEKHKDFILIEPNVKDWSIGFNKAWPYKYWKELIKADYPFLQIGTGWMLDCDYCYTPTFRHALALMERAALVITTDGGLHHAAGAMNIPAVVLWGGLVSPKILGYQNHINLCKAKTFCGSVLNCEHCKKAMESIHPEEVLSILKRLL